MLSSQGKPTDTEAIGKKVLSGTQIQWEQGLDRQQIFRLIESIFSFEACLYHQILPFGLEDKNLLLGMVNPQDSGALDYVSRILSYINCTMETQGITGDTHRAVLSAYLNYKNTLIDIAPEKGAANIPDKPITSTTAYSKPNQQSKLIFTPGQTSQDTVLQPEDTFVQPEDTVLQADFLGVGDSDSLYKTSDNNPFVATSPVNVEKEGDTYGTVTSSNVHVLHVPDPEVFSPVEVLATLPPKKLLEELLGRVLAGGIGRLYLERRPYQGRILWSENGVLQSVLEKLPLSIFQGVLNELKRFASLPVATVVEPKQVEKECLYQQNRLLLRLRVMSGMYGEEATLQVLRGAALKFYQQQQLARLSRDALGISQQLSYKLHELQERLLLNHNFNSEQLQAVTTLNQLLENLNHQIKILSQTSEPSTNIK